MAELATGLPLLPGSSSLDQLWRIMRCFGPLPDHMLQAAAEHSPHMANLAVPPRGRPLRRRLGSLDDPALLSFLDACLQLDPARRPTAGELLSMAWMGDVGLLVAGTPLEGLYDSSAGAAVAGQGGRALERSGGAEQQRRGEGQEQEQQQQEHLVDGQGGERGSVHDQQKATRQDGSRPEGAGSVQDAGEGATDGPVPDMAMQEMGDSGIQQDLSQADLALQATTQLTVPVPESGMASRNSAVCSSMRSEAHGVGSWAQQRVSDAREAAATSASRPVGQPSLRQVARGLMQPHGAPQAQGAATRGRRQFHRGSSDVVESEVRYELVLRPASDRARPAIATVASSEAGGSGGGTGVVIGALGSESAAGTSSDERGRNQHARSLPRLFLMETEGGLGSRAVPHGVGGLRFGGRGAAGRLGPAAGSNGAGALDSMGPLKGLVQLLNLDDTEPVSLAEPGARGGLAELILEQVLAAEAEPGAEARMAEAVARRGQATAQRVARPAKVWDAMRPESPFTTLAGTATGQDREGEQREPTEGPEQWQQQQEQQQQRRQADGALLQLQRPAVQTLGGEGQALRRSMLRAVLDAASGTAAPNPFHQRTTWNDDVSPKAHRKPTKVLPKYRVVMYLHAHSASNSTKCAGLLLASCSWLQSTPSSPCDRLLRRPTAKPLVPPHSPVPAPRPPPCGCRTPPWACPPCPPSSRPSSTTTWARCTPRTGSSCGRAPRRVCTATCCSSRGSSCCPIWRARWSPSSQVRRGNGCFGRLPGGVGRVERVGRLRCGRSGAARAGQCHVELVPLLAVL